MHSSLLAFSSLHTQHGCGDIVSISLEHPRPDCVVSPLVWTHQRASGVARLLRATLARLLVSDLQHPVVAQKWELT